MTRERNRERRHARGHDPYMDSWHRAAQLKRYVGPLRADWMNQIDLDSCEYCHLGGCNEPVALIETKNVEAFAKSGSVTAKLAGRAHLDFYLLEYELSCPLSECAGCGRAEKVDSLDIVRFWKTDEALIRVEMSPQDCAEWLWSLRFRHWQEECTNPRRTEMLSEKYTPNRSDVA